MNEKMKKLLDYHLNRMGIEDRETAEYNLLNVFMPTVLEMESSGDYQAANKVSTAKGGFQFVEGSVVPALNRLERRIGKQDWGTDLRKHKDASKLTPEQQQLLFMGDLLEKKGSDQYMKKVMQGDKQGSMDAYYKLHHTAPDAATKKRAEEIFGNVYSEPQAMNQSTELEQLNEVLSYQVALGRGMKQTMAGFGLYEDKNKGRA
jgi:hypothetical protein